MGNKLEQLLNSLIEKGWKPFGEYKIHSCRYIEGKFKSEYTIAGLLQVLYRSLRELVSKESGLWQFVCENEMVKPVVDIISICSYSHFTDDHDDGGWGETFPEYRLIESALKDESELEDFLLQNIKIGDANN